jgi:ABC-type branched-subunit amino acid transport system substrate-binding protein
LTTGNNVAVFVPTGVIYAINAAVDILAARDGKSLVWGLTTVKTRLFG